MRKKRLVTAAVILCAAGAACWCLSHNGIRRKPGTTEYYYYRYGFADREKSGVIYDRDRWWYVRKGKVDTEYAGVVETASGIWRIRNGTVDTSYQGFDRGRTGWWYIEGGRAREDFTGLKYGEIGTDLAGQFYGSSFPELPALSDADSGRTAGWWYVRNGRAVCCDTIVKENSCWWSVKNGRVWFSFQGINGNENGKFYVENGRVRFDKEGIYRQKGGTWLLEAGKVTGEIHRDSTRFIAHRGLRSEAPENTVKAFELAGEAGFWGCETDVRLTKDGAFVLLHDKSFRRMCGVEATPEELTAEKIRKFSLVSGAGLEEYRGDRAAESVAFLEDYLDVCLRFHMVPVMDIKLEGSGDCKNDFRQMQKLYRAVKAVTGTREAVFLSSDVSMLQQMRRVLDEAGDTVFSLQLLVGDAGEVSEETYKLWGMTPDIKYAGLGEGTISSFQKKGIAVNVWTVDNPYKIDFLLREGADYITTNKRFW